MLALLFVLLPRGLGACRGVSAHRLFAGGGGMLRASLSSRSLRAALCEVVVARLPAPGGAVLRPPVPGCGSGLSVLCLRPCMATSPCAPDGVGFRFSSGWLRWRVPRRTPPLGWASLFSAVGAPLAAGSRVSAVGGGRPPPPASLAPLVGPLPLPAPVGCGIACANGEVNEVCAAVLPRSSFVRGLVLVPCGTSCCSFGVAFTPGLSGRGGVLNSFSKGGGWS